MITSTCFDRVQRCPGSHTLPSAGVDARDELDQAFSEAMRLRLEMTDEQAIDAVRQRRMLALQRVDELRMALHHLAFRPPTGAQLGIHLRMLPTAVERYDPETHALDGSELAVVHVDCLWSEPVPAVWDGVRLHVDPDSVLYALQYRTQSPATVLDTSAQLELLALLAQRFAGSKRVVPVLMYPFTTEQLEAYQEEPEQNRWGGVWDSIQGEWTDVELGHIDQRLRHAYQEAHRQVHLPVAARTFQRGMHCQACPGLVYCPTTKLIGRSLYADMKEACDQDWTEVCSQAEMANLAVLVSLARRIKNHLEPVLRKYVETFGPIPMPDGSVFGFEPHPWTTYDADRVYAILRQKWGDELAEMAAPRRATGRSIETAFSTCRPHGHKSRDHKAALQLLRQQGASQRTHQYWLRQHRALFVQSAPNPRVLEAKTPFPAPSPDDEQWG